MTIHLKRQLAHLKITKHANTYLLRKQSNLKCMTSEHQPILLFIHIEHLLCARHWTRLFHTHSPFNPYEFCKVGTIFVD